MKKIVFITLIALIFVNCKKEGCKDPKAINYDHNEKVTSNPASCQYLNNGTITIAEGDINTPTSWGVIPNASVDYVVNTNIDINSDFTIEPGVVIEFGSNGGFTLKNGSLTAVGTAQNRIIMRNATTEKWDGIITTSTQAQGIKELTLKYVDIANATANLNGNYDPSVSVSKYCNFEMENSTIKGSSGVGLYFSYSSIDNNQFAIENLTITNCVRPVASANEGIIPLIENINLVDNDNNYIELFVNGYQFYGYQLPNDYPIYFSYSGNKTIAAFDAEPGAEIIVNGGQLIFSTEISCQGTAENPITFKGHQGNTWAGLRTQLFYSPSFNYVHIEDVLALANYSAPLFIQSSNSGTLSFNNSTINAPNNSCGIKFTTPVNSNQMIVNNNTFIGVANQVCN